MSFILDALKKSENARQQNTPAEFASVPSRADTPSAPRWLWILGALLAFNAIVLLAMSLRSAGAPSAAAVSAPVTQPPLAANDVRPHPASFEERLSAARDSAAARPAAVRSGTVPEPSAADATTTSAARPAVLAAPVQPAAAADNPFLPSLAELRLDGTLDLPDLHIDIHVYSDNPGDRFVFINMNKYRERDRLAEGPVVREIRADGVVLEHRTTRFLLSRD